MNPIRSSYRFKSLFFAVGTVSLMGLTVSAVAAVPSEPANITAGYVYDVSKVSQDEQPNLSNVSGASVTIVSTGEDTGSATGSKQPDQPASDTVSKQVQFADVPNTSGENVVSLLERDPTLAVMLPEGKRVVIVDTGSIATFSDFKLKSFGAESLVAVEIAADATSVNPEAWSAVQEKKLFSPQNPLIVDMNKRVGRYIRVTFETSKAGYVGCLRVTGSSERRAATATVKDAEGNIPKNMSIKKVTHVNSGDLVNIQHLTDNDFTTSYNFDQNKPVIMVFETRAMTDQPIERISILVNDLQPDGKFMVYGVDQVPVSEPTAKGDGPQTPQVQLQSDFLQSNMPLGEVQFSTDGRASINLPEPSTANYLVTVSQGTGVHSVAEVYAGPQPDFAQRNLQSQALLNNLQRIPNPAAARVAPQLPPASAVTP